ncbi:MAG: hypothetical protein OEZ22_02565 [Spirochaetia bacterium]|nr:hypothetical protein [Spirochaetia bacterium]
MQVRKKYTYFFIVCFLGTFIFKPYDSLFASKKLQDAHEKNIKKKMQCKDCHHKIDGQMDKKISGEIKKKNSKYIKSKYCSECHFEGKEEIKEYDALPKELKLVHKKCRECHLKPEYKEKQKEININIKKYLKSKSGCVLCHK